MFRESFLDQGESLSLRGMLKSVFDEGHNSRIFTSAMAHSHFKIYPWKVSECLIATVEFDERGRIIDTFDNEQLL